MTYVDTIEKAVPNLSGLLDCRKGAIVTTQKDSLCLSEIEED